MEISRYLPDPVPENWDKLEKKLERLAREFSLDDISFCADQLLAKRADAKVVELLRPLLVEFKEVKRIHVYYDSDPGCFHVYLEMEKGMKTSQKLRAMKNWIIVESSSVKFRYVADRINFVASMAIFKLQSRNSQLAKIIERQSA